MKCIELTNQANIEYMIGRKITGHDTVRLDIWFRCRVTFVFYEFGEIGEGRGSLTRVKYNVGETNMHEIINIDQNVMTGDVVPYELYHHNASD